MNAAAVLTDTLYLNAMGDANAVFVIQVNGAFSTSTYSKVILTNGTQAKNVFWKIDGAVNINDYSVFNGSVICNNGAVSLNTGTTVNGRVFTTTGTLTTQAITATIPPGCIGLGIGVTGSATGEAVTVYPNPFTNQLFFNLNSGSTSGSCQLVIYNVLGEEVMGTTINGQTAILETSALPAGIYFYKITGQSKTIQAGRLVSIQ